MTDTARYPNLLDATPDDTETGEYGYEFLLAAGYLTDCRSDTVSYDADAAVRYLYSTDGAVRIAYFEFPMANVPRETLSKITQALRRRTRLQYFWFVDPDIGQVRVLRASRGTLQFSYDPATDSESTAERKQQKLQSVPEDINALFEYQDVVDRFYRALWDHRSALADCVATESGDTLSKQEELLSAQRIIDRLVFLYFLVERGLIIPVTDSGTMQPEHTEQVFATLVNDSDDFWSVLRTILFDRLGSRRRNRVRLSDSRWLHVPALSNDLFDAAALGAVDGTALAEDEKLVVEGFDWNGLISELNEYTWQLDGIAATDENDTATAGVLTPEVLGYVYEKFVISVSKVGADVRLSELDPSERTELLAEGNSEVGAYYTGEEIADFKARRALWEGLRAKIEADIAAGDAPPPLASTELYRPGTERVEAVEAAQQDGFDVLYAEHNDCREVLQYVDSKLTELTVCDPAVGSGSFALAVANTLFEWRSMCRPTADEQLLRRQIITQNVFGVDIQSGATEICRLRLWLWVISTTPVETAAGASVDSREPIPPLADITFNIRTGNSLLGLTEMAGLSGPQQTLESSEMRAQLRTYGADVHSYRNATDPETATKRELERRHDELKRELDARYARAQLDTDTNRLTVPDHVETVEAAWESLHAASPSSTTLAVEIPAGIPEATDSVLRRHGFTTYTYKARLERPTCTKQELRQLVDHLRQQFSDTDAWNLIVEREYVGADFSQEALDACHWPLEFPVVFLEHGGFDVVISNPPYGATLRPEETPLIQSETNYACQGTNDSCEWFYERALDLVHDQGVVSYIVNKSIAFYSSWSDIRTRLLDETELTHIFDVGLGFVGVNLETIAIISTLGGEGQSSTPAVHRSRDLRRTTANQPVHLGWVDQAFMLDSQTIIFRPITDDQSDVLDRLRSHDRRLGDVMSTEDTTRQLYIPDSKKETLASGNDPYINKNPWVQEFYLEDIWQTDLREYREAATRYAVPRVMLKVLRGTRLRAWIDAAGEVVGTEKLVNVPLEHSHPEEIAFVYAALNHPCASFYLQKTIFSETTESARVMDGQYSKPIPIPAVSSETETAVAHLAWLLTLAKQVDHDTSRAFSTQVQTLQTGLNAILSGVYLQLQPERVSRWCDSIAGRSEANERVSALFDAFYTERFATPDGNPEQFYDEIAAEVESTAELVSAWNTAAVSESDEMAVVEDVL